MQVGARDRRLYGATSALEVRPETGALRDGWLVRRAVGTAGWTARIRIESAVCAYILR